MLESRRNGSGRTVAIWCGGRRRGIGVALPAGEGAVAPGAGEWRWGGDESPLHGEAGGRIGWCGRGHAAVPVSVYGAKATGPGRACGADGHGRGRGARGCGGGSWLAVVGGRQIYGRTNDFAGCGGAAFGWGARIAVLWLSAAPSPPAGNETSGPPCARFDTDAVPAGNARRTCGSHVVASGLREARAAGDGARH